MFKLNPAPTFRAKVSITVPGGESKPIEFVFRHKTKTGLAEWQANMAGKGDLDLVPEFVAGWSGVIGPDGAEVPWSLEAFATFADNYPAASVEIYGAYLRELTTSRVLEGKKQ